MEEFSLQSRFFFTNLLLNMMNFLFQLFFFLSYRVSFSVILMWMYFIIFFQLSVKNLLF